MLGHAAQSGNLIENTCFLITWKCLDVVIVYCSRRFSFQISFLAYNRLDGVKKWKTWNVSHFYHPSHFTSTQNQLFNIQGCALADSLISLLACKMTLMMHFCRLNKGAGHAHRWSSSKKKKSGALSLSCFSCFPVSQLSASGTTKMVAVLCK